MTNEEIQVIYLQECEEGLASAETALLDIKSGAYDAETINTIFRAVHSIKGGAGAFGFSALQSFTHHFETLLDKVRDGEIAISPSLVGLLIAAFDVLSDHVGAIRGDCGLPDDAAMLASLQDAVVAPVAEAATDDAVAAPELEIAPDMGLDDLGLGDLGFDLAAMMAEMDVVVEETLGAVEAAPTEQPAPERATPNVVELAAAEPELPGAPSEQADDWHVRFTPRAADMTYGGEPLLLVREVGRLGGVTVSVDLDRVPSLDRFDPTEAYLSWLIRVPAAVPEGKIREIFDFVADPAAVIITRGEPEALPAFFEVPFVPEAAPVAVTVAAPVLRPTEVAAPVVSASAAKVAGGATIRVDLDKLDRLVNLVGELVITQSMLSQRLLTRSGDSIQELSDLDQLTRELQDSAMAIRAQPVKSVFSRVPRIVRELETATGKRVQLEVEGESTELDKTVIERIGEPLTHLIRNSVDHGIEMPADRIAKGKPAEGRLRLCAEHKSGRIVISVSDDGAGIDRARVLAIAIERGIVSPDAKLADEEIDNLIFAPGFSTAKQVSNISGRGVGMDVVRQSVHALGGRITIQSTPGHGSTFTLALPLTLAIADGMIVSVGDQTFVVPLTHVIESLRPEAGAVQTTGFGNNVLNVRGAYLPVLNIGKQLGIADAIVEPSQAVLIIVDTEASGQAILIVDAIVDQRQVVIKSLETHYQQVEGVAGATILGDGRVALILDVEAMVAMQTGSAQRLWAS